MSKYETLEVEWRVRPDPAMWSDLREQLSQRSDIGMQSSRVCDLVLGRHGFDSVDVDGFVVRLRGPHPFRLELKRRQGENEWREISVSVDSPDATLAILRHLGLSPHLVIDRIRNVYNSNCYNICFDDISDLGRYVEVEEIGIPDHTDPLADVVELLKVLPKEPAYGDIVRKRLGDSQFRDEFGTKLKNFKFEGIEFYD
jgi:adenylate cyclase class IV